MVIDPRRLSLLGVVLCVLGAGRARAEQPVPLPRWRQQADPAPLLTAEYLELSVAKERGVLRVIGVEKGRFARPQVLSPRFRGRFEVRLFSVSGQLRDVVRFDLPLTGAGSTGRPPGEDDLLGRKLSQGVSARTRVRVPFDASIASAVIRDTLQKTELRVDLSKLVTRPPSLRLPPPKLLPPPPRRR